jgi:hypothetical protein
MADLNLPEALSDTANPTGRAFFDGTTCQYADLINAGDMVLADFDATRVSTGGGLYLIEERNASDEVRWRGCRRMMKTPHGIDFDATGTGEWMRVPDLNGLGLQVVGTVVSVYKPTRYA